MDENKNKQPEEFQDADFRDTFGDGEELKKVFYTLSEKLYQQSGAQGGPNPGEGFNGGANDDGTVDADYEVK